MKDPIVKILVCYHKPDCLFKDDILTPIHVGRSLAKKILPEDDVRLEWLLSNLIGDDTGDNISDKNSLYNELTAVYWAWKNYEKLGNPDYIGLMHYRRHFVFREMSDIIDVFVDQVDENYYSLINYSRESILEMLSEVEFIFHEGKVDSIRKHYADNHNIKDLHSAISIIDETQPSYSKTAHRYLDQDRGSFCNMFIFPRKMFFDYCEWLFSILESFESTHDLSDKRLFISERLTGIYIQKRINEGARYKNLPITLIREPITVPIAMQWDGDLFSTAVTILSHEVNADSTTSYMFYIIGNPDEYQSNCLKRLSEDFNFGIEVINPLDHLDQHGFNPYLNDSIPLILHLLLPRINKCIYLNNRMLSMRDESEFYRTCNVDDFWICGIPEGDDNPMCEDRQITLDLLVINLRRFRDYKTHEGYSDIIADGTSDPKDILHNVCGSNVGYCPPWFYKKAITEGRSDLFDSKKKRGQLQHEANWSSYVFFNGHSPIESMQGIYSILWWNIASKVPGYIQYLKFDTESIRNTMIEQQHRVNLTLDNPLPSLKDRWEYKNSSIKSDIHRLRNAYRKYGFTETMRLGIEYIRRGRK